MSPRGLAVSRNNDDDHARVIVIAVAGCAVCSSFSYLSDAAAGERPA